VDYLSRLLLQFLRTLLDALFQEFAYFAGFILSSLPPGYGAPIGLTHQYDQARKK